MNSGRPASLDSSLLARKGAATPAIPDESPLVLHLDEHRPEPFEAEPTQQGKTAEASDEDGAAGTVLQRASGWFSRLPARFRWTAIAVLAAIVGAAAWLSTRSGEPVPVGDQQTSVVAPEKVKQQGAGLNLVPAAGAPTPRPAAADNAGPTEIAMPLPTSAAVAASGVAGADIEAVSEGADLESTPPASERGEPASGTLIPVNVPPSDAPAVVEGVDPTPAIRAAVPKTVSPVPVPKAKPEPVAVAVGRYAIQLASIGIEKRATEEAFRLQKQFGDVLGGREIRVESARVEGKGTMYRLRANGYRSLADARAACAQIERLKGNCLALRR